MRKTRGAPFPSRARLIFALLVLIRPHYASLSQATQFLAHKPVSLCFVN